MGFRTSSARRSSAQSAVASSIVVLPDTTGTGPTISGSGVTANTTINKQIVTVGTNTSQSTTVLSGVTVTSVFVTDSSFNNLDDTALDPAGGYLKIIGNGFKTGCTVYLNGSSVTTTLISSTELRVTTPSTAAGTYNLMVFNPDGNGAIYLNLGVSNFPAYTTSAGSLGTVYETNPYTQSVVATGDAPLVYSLFSGSLPPNATLSSNGVISGTSPVENASNTYSFVVNVKDAQGQDSTRSFSLTISTDTVTWSSPANNTVYTVDADQLISNVTLSATSAGGKTITYTANTLPTGITLSGNTIYGTPNTEQTIYTELTATSNTSNRTAKRYISWTVNVGDAYAKYVALLLSAKTTLQNASYINDNSTNKFLITPVADTRASNFSPYTSGYYSAYFDGTGDYLQTPASSTSTIMGGSGGITTTSTFTVEGWIYQTTRQSYDSGCMIGDMGTNGSIYWGFGPNATGKLAFNWYDGATKSAVGDTTIPLNTWTHIALSVSSGSIKLFVNGILQTITGTSSTTNQSGTFNYLLIGGFYTFGSTYGYYGFISNLRITKSALYSTTFTPSTTSLTAIANTSLLACQSNRFIDTSNNVLTITRNGDTTINTANPFSVNSSYATYGSGYFDGTGDYLNIASSPINIGTNDFTLEGWVYRTATPTLQTFFSFNSYTSGILMRWETTVIGIYIGGTSYSFALPDRIPLNVWTHVAMVRTNGVVIIYFNGVEATRFNSTYSLSITTAMIGRSIHASNELWYGYISDVRLVANTALYTANTAPPTAPLTAVANTQLLTLQTNGNANNAFHKDGSSFNNIINKGGNPTQGTFSPYGADWSNYFEGSSSYLTFPSSTQYAFGTGAYTFEGWVFLPTGTNNKQITVQGSQFLLGTGGYAGSTVGCLRYYAGPTATTFVTTSSYLIANDKWNHFAVVRENTSSNGFKMYINGMLVFVGTDTANYGTSGVVNVGSGGGNDYLPGYISNFRIVKGSAVYTTASTTVGTQIFTPPTTPLTAIANTSLLTCQSNRFIDNSPNGFSPTLYGTPKIQSFAPFGQVTTTTKSYSNYFDGSGDYLSIPTTGNQLDATGDFTTEMWIYWNSMPTTGYQNICGQGAAGQNSYGLYAANAAGNTWSAPYKFKLNIANDGDYLTGNTTLVAGQWYHLAHTRTSGVNRLFVNGVLQTNTYTDSTSRGFAGNPYTIGNNSNCYISNFRYIKGTSLYTTTFTPSTAPLTAVANTQLLTCQSSTIIDNSNNYMVITGTGDTKPLPFNPFGEANTRPTSYSSSVFGGSVYLDGTGDYLLSPHQPTQLLRDLDFTIEAWVYTTKTGSEQVIVGKQWQGSQAAYASYVIYLEVGNTVRVLGSKSGGAWELDMSSSTYVIRQNTWTHVALTRSGTTFRLFFNGILDKTTTLSGALQTYTDPLTVGAAGPQTSYNAPFQGWISDLRIITGKALYTNNFYPGNTPLTAIEYSNNSTSIANTSYATFLLSGTSAGVIDASRNTTIETVGDARVTTNTSPYATTSQSYYFDGSTSKLVIPASSNWIFGTGDFTIEFWMRTIDTSAGLITPATTGSGYWAILLAGGTLYWQSAYNTTNLKTQSMTGYLNNSWVHLAIVRSSGSLNFYLNGTVQGTSTSDTTNYNGTSNALTIGQDPQTNGYYSGYLADLRITKGYARYTTNFTVPSGPLSEK